MIIDLSLDLEFHQCLVPSYASQSRNANVKSVNRPATAIATTRNMVENARGSHARLVILSDRY